MEKSNDDRPRPLKERRNYYDSENRPVPRTPRPGASRPSRSASEGETPGGYRRPESRPDGFIDARPDGPRGNRDTRDNTERRSSSDKARPFYANRPAPDRSIDMLFGLRPIMEALSAGRTLEKIFLLRGTKNSLTQEINDMARQQGIPVSSVPVEKLDNLTRKNHQGAVAFVSPIDYMPLDSILSGLYEEGKVPFLLILDRVTDVRNFGAIARNAECMGVHAIVVPSQGAAQINGDAVKTSAGALNLIPVCREANLKNTLTYLRESGVQVIACTEKADASLETGSVDMTGPVAVLMGSEEDGISPEYLRLSDHRLRIPMTGQIGSLNVSVASGIMLFEVLRQRLTSTPSNE
ncbi:23S rRNA (guanosine(2251)-2'-O)-methyltransferase RlmB [Hymenobacter norwichensis]|uniref:23S rRNA (guanosine(2251)-2'-O)-methyltransferase RlmB n=1 Tax=Hymenobacter norwichensis TaxID=223903 RepID=UPI0003B3E457|nr:23S rRNA (guanosine(2251)-2'-O)-methyltransferase RlmB [Hymenobacter norwichensis]